MTDGSLCLSVFGGATQLTATETHTSESRKKQLTEERERESRWGIARDGATQAYLCPFLITLVRASSPPSLGRVPAGLGRRGGAGGHPGALPSAKPASRWVAPVPAASRAAPLPTTARRAKAGRGASLGRRRPPTFATSRRVNAVVRPPSRCRTGARLGGPPKPSSSAAAGTTAVTSVVVLPAGVAGCSSRAAAATASSCANVA